MQFELNQDFKRFLRICISTYRTPPSKAQYLQLYHTLGDAGMCVNGRKFMGNTPTMVAHPTLANQPGTKMRFGVVGMGDESNIHTFHIHGHRWVITGPDGTNTGTIMNSPQIRPVSQFEDTRAFGPANSFGFTIDEDSSSFMRAEPAIGETPGAWFWGARSGAACGLIVCVRCWGGAEGGAVACGAFNLEVRDPASIPRPATSVSGSRTDVDDRLGDALGRQAAHSREGDRQAV